MRSNENEEIINPSDPGSGHKSQASSESCDDVECALIDSNPRKRLKKASVEFHDVNLNDSDLGKEKELNMISILKKHGNMKQLQQENAKLGLLIEQIKHDSTKDTVVRLCVGG